MNIKILPASKAKTKDVFVVSMKFMHGDADAYTTEKVNIKNEADLIRLLETFQKIGRRPKDETIWEYQEKCANNDIIAIALDE